VRWSLLGNFSKTSYDGKLSFANVCKLAITIVIVAIGQGVWLNGEISHHATCDFQKGYLNHY
jgi:hypothetical protein